MSSPLRFAALTALVLTAPAAVAGASPIVQIAGTTDGCFGAGCSTFAGSASSGSPYGLTFTAGGFDVTTDASGSFDGMLFGTLARGNVNTSSGSAPLAFTLRLLFSMPAGQNLTVPIQITGSSPGGGGPLNLDLPASQLVSFDGPGGTGSFQLLFADMVLNKNSEISIYGWIRGASLTSTSLPVDESTPQAVPEPATILLVGLGAAAALRRRARKP